MGSLAFSETSQVDVINYARDAVLARNAAEMTNSEPQTVTIFDVGFPVNGVLSLDGYYDGRPRWSKLFGEWETSIYWNTNHWYLYDDLRFEYWTNYEDTFVPNETGWSLGNQGSSAPTLELSGYHKEPPWGGHSNGVLIVKHSKPPKPPSGLWYTGNGYIFYTAEGYKFILTN
jgi:hypothetical protein